MDDSYKLKFDDLFIYYFLGNKTPLVRIKLENQLKFETFEQFLSHYHFSKWKKGKFFLKRLILRSLKIIRWENEFWERNCVYLFQSSINYDSDFTMDRLTGFLIKNQSKRRINDIQKYQKLIKGNIDLGEPLYILKSSFISIIKSEDHKRLYQIDGSRRLIAHLMAQKNTINIWLIAPRS